MAAPSGRWQTPLHSALREATGDIHARIDALLAGGLAARSDYACYLRGMHAFMRAACRAQPARADWRALGAHLDADLAALDVAALTPPPARHADDEAARIGWEYVVGGASLGARVLLRGAHALGFDGGSGADFLRHHAAAGAHWPGWLARLAAHPHAGDARFVVRTCQAAREAFFHAESAMAAACQERP